MSSHPPTDISRTNSTALTTQSNQSTLTAPKPRIITLSSGEIIPLPPKLARPPVPLEEDEYTEALSTIIKRDFFPDIDKFKAQHELMDAMESKDRGWIEGAEKRVLAMEAGRAATPRGKRARVDTPGATPMTVIGGQEEEKPAAYDTSVSLDKFQQKYTSEDNADFADLVDRENVTRRIAHSWAFTGRNKLITAGQAAQNAERKAIEANIDSVDVGTLKAIGWNEGGKPIETWKNEQPLSTLMYPPSTSHPKPETGVQARAAPKVISHAATRLPESSTEDTLSASVVPSPSYSTVGRAIRGEHVDTPKVNGWGFVDAYTPTPGPPSRAQTPMAGPTPGTFKIPPTPRRDGLAHALADKHSKRKAVPGRGDSLARVMKQVPKFKSGPDMRQAMLSPAGQRLLGVTKTVRPGSTLRDSLRTPRGSENGSGMGGRPRWEATPRMDDVQKGK
ncbi:hypothetical protein SAICODRAFT_128905 [Saitoella complicata NRRL Y-17804]|uniref:Nuclear protein DGCR14 n=1 Tax=Saitoella complicata (strain BCRC 22490 / CBS 7301 / JCM 7358 / NBRC 10748 / NRRL Y-17804) TaxID=698492 RepID=A0A0E9NKW4_SAICN|nr:uncharacterized protein SAICODRAFT_128905 [Saitoella complicata NRRL Y-17804]ODQ52447.1 hypothetical protein SAICODRAFT_128905 [Saitoella complicata NRRL Y-17804]GAO50517.1 hypothetical protein G7K_4641-t1 [Saitoella complicata NRRL Y-17804]